MSVDSGGKDALTSVCVMTEIHWQCRCVVVMSIFVCSFWMSVFMFVRRVSIFVCVVALSIFVCLFGMSCLFGGCQYLCVLWRFQQSCVRLIDNRICKANFECERFLFLLPCKLRKILVKCRPTNDYLPVEVGNWKGVQRSKHYYNNWQ